MPRRAEGATAVGSDQAPLGSVTAALMVSGLAWQAAKATAPTISHEINSTRRSQARNIWRCNISLVFIRYSPRSRASRLGLGWLQCSTRSGLIARDLTGAHRGAMGMP